MGKLKKYAFMHITKSGAKKEYRKDEHELTEEEHEILYIKFAQEWDYLPLNGRNRFMKWFRQNLQARQDAKDNQNN